MLSPKLMASSGSWAACSIADFATKNNKSDTLIFHQYYQMIFPFLNSLINYIGKKTLYKNKLSPMHMRWKIFFLPKYKEVIIMNPS